MASPDADRGHGSGVLFNTLILALLTASFGAAVARLSNPQIGLDVAVTAIAFVAVFAFTKNWQRAEVGSTVTALVSTVILLSFYAPGTGTAGLFSSVASPSPSGLSPTPTPLAGPTYLDTLKAVQGDNPTRGVVSINGTRYGDGLQFTLGVGGEIQRATYRVVPGEGTFSAKVGSDDIQPNSHWSENRITYEVFVDGVRKAAVQSQGQTPTQFVSVDIRQASTVELVVTNASGCCATTVVDWGDPEFKPFDILQG